MAGSTVGQAQGKNLFEFLDSGIISSNDFAKRIVKSGLISREDVERTWAELAKPRRTPSGLANELANRFRLLPSQAAVLAESADLPLVLGSYVIEGKLGQGGMGTVYHAVHRKMKREVALKVISLKGKNLIRRFDREVELISRLSHPNVVAAHDAGDSQGIHYLVMERVHGIDLGSLVETNGPVPIIKALDLVRQAARGLAYAHAQGIVHRDVKPSNLLVDNHGIVKILDLGIARLDGADEDLSSIYRMTHTGAMMGTVDYMSPEQAMDAKSANAQSDIYSLGCTLFFLATGRAMYDGDTAMKRIFAHREEPIPQLSGFLTASSENHTIIDDAQRIFEQMVAKRPRARYSGMIDVVNTLDNILIVKESTHPLRPPKKAIGLATSDVTEVPSAITDTQVPGPSIASPQRSDSQLGAAVRAIPAKEGGATTFTNSVGITMNLIPAGTFLMGSPESDSLALDSEKPQHNVTLTQAFYMAITQVTQGQWKSVMGTEPWKGQPHVREGTNYPATYVDWDDAVEYCWQLSDREGRPYRLPTEAEWEYACRAGTTTRYSFGDDESELPKYAWFRSNTNAVGDYVGDYNLVQQKLPNGYGLYDMHGNVAEWCSDAPRRYSSDQTTDPVGSRSGSRRVYRGGCWFFDAAYCRTAYRFTDVPTHRTSFSGLRLVLSSPSGVSGPAARRTR